MFEPIFFANLSLAFMFVARPLSVLATRQTVHLGISVMPQFDYTLFVALAGIFAFQIGYHSRVTLDVFNKYAGLLPAPSREFRADRAGQLGILVAVVGLGLFGIFIMQSGGVATLVSLASGRGASDDAFFLSSNGYFYNGILALIPASALLFAASLTTKRLTWLVGSAISVAIFCGFSVGRGDRSNLLPLLAIPMFWYTFRRRRPSAALLVLSTAVAISGISILREVRNVDSVFTQSEIKDALVQPWNAALATLQGADAEMFDTMANEISIVPSVVGYQHGAIITDLLVRVVPRPLWPEKSTESMDFIGQTLWPAHYALTRAGAASSIIGNLYADSGLITVVLGMPLIGAALRWFWLWYSKYRDSVGAQLLYASTVPFTVILLRGTFPDTFSRMLFAVAPLLIALRAVGSPARRTAAISAQP
jgi:uncharacterized membrane protein